MFKSALLSWKAIFAFFIFYLRTCPRYLICRIFTAVLARMVKTNDPEVVWDEPNEVDDKWTQIIDDNVLASKLSS